MIFFPYFSLLTTSSSTFGITKNRQHPTRWDPARLDWFGNGPTLPRATNEGCQTLHHERRVRCGVAWDTRTHNFNGFCFTTSMQQFLTLQKWMESKFNGKSLDCSRSWYLWVSSCLFLFSDYHVLSGKVSLEVSFLTQNLSDTINERLTCSNFYCTWYIVPGHPISTTFFC